MHTYRHCPETAAERREKASAGYWDNGAAEYCYRDRAAAVVVGWDNRAAGYCRGKAAAADWDSTAVDCYNGCTADCNKLVDTCDAVYSWAAWGAAPCMAFAADGMWDAAACLNMRFPAGN